MWFYRERSRQIATYSGQDSCSSTSSRCSLRLRGSDLRYRRNAVRAWLQMARFASFASPTFRGKKRRSFPVLKPLDVHDRFDLLFQPSILILIQLLQSLPAKVAIDGIPGICHLMMKIVAHFLQNRTFERIALLVRSLALTPFLITQLLRPLIDIESGSADDLVISKHHKILRNRKPFRSAHTDMIEFSRIPEDNVDHLLRRLQLFRNPEAWGSSFHRFSAASLFPAAVLL